MSKHLFLVFFVLSACSILPKPAALHDFGLPATSKTSDHNVPQPSTIIVEAPQWLYDNRIRYRLLYAAPTQVRFYTLDRWLAPPPELFEQVLAANAMGTVADVTIELLEFEQQFATSGQAKVIMTFTASLKATEKDTTTFNREFSLQTPCLSPDAKGAVTGFSVLTKEAVKKIQLWLNEIESAQRENKTERTYR